MAGFDWKGTIGTVVPALAGMLGSPVAGLAVGALCRALGMEPSVDNAQKIAQQVADGTLSGPDLLKLREAEIQATSDLKKMGYDYNLEEDKIVASDLADARGREEKTADKTPEIGFYLLTVGFFGLLTVLMLVPLQDASKAIIYTMTGFLGNAWLSAVHYFYGTTRNSGDKDQMLYNSAPSIVAAK